MGGATEDSETTEVDRALGILRSALQRLDPDSTPTAQAMALVELFAQVERLGAAGKALMARRVERSGGWRREGHRSAAHWMAAATGMAVGQAVGTLDTARRLDRLPATARAYAAGGLTETQVREVAAAAEASPEHEGELLHTARTETVASLVSRCRTVRAGATDRDQALAAIHRGRYLRHWTDPEGAVRLEARLTPEDGAVVLAGMDPHRRRIARAARGAGRWEHPQAHAADALVALARSGRSGPGAVVHVRVDHGALVRGHPGEGETCEIPGIGPIPVAAARRLGADAIVEAVVARGADVTAVAHVGRTIPRKLRMALEARDQTCVVPGCDAREDLQIDHRVPFALGGRASVDNTARLCGYHHGLKTFHGYSLGGGPGNWTWTGPDPPGGGH